MVNVYIASYASNDLYYYTRESLKRILTSLEQLNKLNIYGLFSFKDIDKENIWLNYPKDQCCNIEELAFIYRNNEFNVVDIKEYYYKIEENLAIMDLEVFLQKNNINNNSNNIVIVSGHGGLFQSLLDMSQPIRYSINTVYLCNMLKQFNIDLLILDMCSMNYIEIIYELLKDSQIKNILLFQGLAPLEGVDIEKVLNIFNNTSTIEGGIKELLRLKEYSFMLVSREKINEIEKLKTLINKEYLLYLLSKSEDGFNTNKIVEELRNIVIKGDGYIKELEPVLFLSKPLKDTVEQAYYMRYKFSKNNFFTQLLCNEAIELEFMPITIKLTDKNLMHIISIYNPKFTSEKLKVVCEKYNNSLIKM